MKKPTPFTNVKALGKAFTDTACFGWYTEFAVPVWLPELAGPKPSAEMLNVAHKFNKPGKHALAMAMFMRDDGATHADIAKVFTTQQNNNRGDLIRAGYFTLVPHENRNSLTVYKVALTDLGVKYCKNMPDKKAGTKATREANAAFGASLKAAPAPVKAKAKKPLKVSKVAAQVDTEKGFASKLAKRAAYAPKPATPAPVDTPAPVANTTDTLQPTVSPPTASLS
jgi:hypothetical protein